MKGPPLHIRKRQVARSIVNDVAAKRAEVVERLHQARAAGDAALVADLEEKLAAADRLATSVTKAGELPRLQAVPGGRG